jgi:hypothetical protein
LVSSLAWLIKEVNPKNPDRSDRISKTMKLVTWNWLPNCTLTVWWHSHANATQPLCELLLTEVKIYWETTLGPNAQIGQTQSVQTSTDLFTWSPLTNVTMTNVPMDIVDLGASNSPTRFYRALSQ